MCVYFVIIAFVGLMFGTVESVAKTIGVGEVAMVVLRTIEIGMLIVGLAYIIL